MFLNRLKSKGEVDEVIRSVSEKVLVIRFGRQDDPTCLLLDNILLKAEKELSKMASIYTVEVDDVTVYVKYFDISLIPSTLFFFNAQHIKVEFGTPDNTKFVGAFANKQDFIDLIEVIYRGATKGKYVVSSPIDPKRVPKYQLLYQDF